ncbi:hypothetical protein FOL47_001076, partial [Perkinsus chesapeaki]
NEWLDPAMATEIRKWLSTEEVQNTCYAFLDFSVPLPGFDPNIIDEQLDKLLWLEEEARKGADAVPLLGPWAKEIARYLPPKESSQGASPSEQAEHFSPKDEYGRLVFVLMVYAGGIHGASPVWLCPLAAYLAGQATKRAYRLARLASLGNEKTFLNSFVGGFNASSRQATSLHVEPETSSPGHGYAKVDESKLPSVQEGDVFDGPDEKLTYTAFKCNLQISLLFYGLKGRAALVYLVRHLGASLRLEVAAGLDSEKATVEDVWRCLDSKYGGLDNAQTAACRWENTKQKDDEDVLKYYARLRTEATLFRKVTNVGLSEPLVTAKFVAGFRSPIKHGLEQSCGHRLLQMGLEEIRDAAIYQESRLRTVSGAPPRPGKPRPDAQKGQTQAAVGSATPSTATQKQRCSYCAEKGLRGGWKHSDEECWKNPKNESKVPQWYKDKQKARSGRGDDTSRGAPRTFMVGCESVQGVVAQVPASGQTPGGEVLMAIDTGADLNLISSAGVRRLGLVTERLDEPVVLSTAKQGETIKAYSKATTTLCVPGRGESVTRFILDLYVSDDLSEVIPPYAFLLGMGSMRRMGAKLCLQRGIFYSEALGAEWELVPLPGYTGGRPLFRLEASESHPREEGVLELPSREEIRQRLGTWEWPKVHVDLKPNAIRPKPRLPYRTDEREQKATGLLVDLMVRDGIAEFVDDDAVVRDDLWVVSCFVVGKVPDEELPEAEGLDSENVSNYYRLVIDERPVNEVTKELPRSWDTYQSTIPQVLAVIPSSGSVFYGSLDIKNAYYNLEYEASSQRLFGFCFRDREGRARMVKHTRLTMGWVGSASWWCYAIHSLFMTSMSELLDQRRAPERKRKGPSKEIDFLGFQLRQGVYSVSPKSVSAAREALGSPPTTLRGLRSKIGVLQFCKSLWNPELGGQQAANTLSHRLAPFTDLIGECVAKGARGNYKINWTAEHARSWKELLDSMGSGVMHFHRPEDEFRDLQFLLMVDASPHAGAAVLFRLQRSTLLAAMEEGVQLGADWVSDNGRLIAVWTHKWSRHERRYDIADKELYAACHGLKEWRQLILSTTTYARLLDDYTDSDDKVVYKGSGNVGRILLLTDSTSSLGKLIGRFEVTRFAPDARQSKRWLTWLTWLYEFGDADITFKHVGGKQNGFADALSRLLDGGRKYLPEGRDSPVVLWVTRGSAFDPRNEPRGDGSSQFSPQTFLENEEVRQRLLELQGVDSSTILHGLPLAKWVSALKAQRPDGVLAGPAAEAYKLGLVALVGGCVCVFGDVDENGGVAVPAVPQGKLDAFGEVVSINCDADWDLRTWFLFTFHELAVHQGTPSMKGAMDRSVWWPGIGRDRKEWIQRCDVCMENRRAGRLASLTAPRVPRGLVDPDQRLKHVCIDHAFPDPDWMSARDPSHKAFLVVTDLATGFCVAVPVASTSGEHTIMALWDRWISLFGLPLTVVSDNAVDSSVFRKHLLECGVSYLTTPAWSPQSNGTAEGRVGQLKRRINVCCRKM